MLNYGLILVASVFLGIFVASYTDYILKRSVRVVNKRTIGVVVLHAMLWLLIVVTNGFSLTSFLYMAATSALLALSLVDLEIYEIPPQFNVWIALMGIVQLISDKEHWYVYLIGAVFVSGIFFAIALITKGNGMGGGDIKLMAAAGLLLGWQKIFLVMLIGSMLGAVIHSIIMKVSKKEHMLAFGPYLSAATVLVMCFGERIIDWYIINFLTF